jgi:Rha family phage regulatory protein
MQNSIVVFDKEKFYMDSRSIAEIFGKEHKSVLRAIRNLESSDEFSQLNFAPSFYINSQNKVQPMYLLTKDGFTLLAFGFTGKKAMEFKELYIEKFNAMEAELRNQENKKLTAIEEIRALLTIEEKLMMSAQYLLSPIETNPIKELSETEQRN